MNTVARYVIAVVAVVLALHSILSFTNANYGRVTSISNIASQLTGNKPIKAVPDSYYLNDEELLIDHTAGSPPATGGPKSYQRANATLLMLARNSDLDNAVRSVRRLEDRFNRKFGYPWVFLNEEPFDDRFKKRISVLVSGAVEFVEIPHDDWYQPDWVDEKKAEEGRNQLVQESVIYGGSVPYRNMCRFNSGFFYRQKALQKYRWYWRVEPDVHFHCNIDFDPFHFMQDHNKTYGFTITLYEFEKTIPTLWKNVKEFTTLHPEYVARDNLMGFLSDNNGDSYNLCHFWSNFEIADLDFWRGEAYTAFFDFLDKKGGFYYERWGDAPVHSIAAALFAQRDQIHFFDEIGYEHNPYTHCPQKEASWSRGHCSCEQSRSFDYDGYSCMRKWDAVMS